jgi:hypothetical protein
MKHILNNISQEEKQRILEQHSGGKFIDTSGFKRLLESKLGNVKPLLMEGPTGTTQTAATNTTPGDPSQSTVDLSTEYATLKTALATYNSTVNSIMEVNPGLFFMQSEKSPSELLISDLSRQDDSTFLLKYNIPTGVLTRRLNSSPPKFFTLQLNGDSIGTSGQGIWYFRLSDEQRNKANKVEKVKAAAKIVGDAIGAFFTAVQTKVPKNYVVTQRSNSTDTTNLLVFGPKSA